MTKHIQLIELYCAVCHHYNNTLVAHAQRLSNNFSPKFTDEECITILIWGIYNQKLDVKRCHEFVTDYYGDWFPTLPEYHGFNKRVNYLSDTFKAFADILLSGLGLDGTHTDFIYDSMPVVVAGSARSGRAKAAKELCSKGYCASKKMWYYGVKLHTIAQCNHKAMPTPSVMQISKASEHDRPIAGMMLDNASNIRLFADMALADAEFKSRMLTENNVEILTPVKRGKGQEHLHSGDKLFSRAVSSVKQAIESFNNWLIERTGIQRASKVRSAFGLTAFLFARIACACFFFNS
jgi:hypothetical protein